VVVSVLCNGGGSMENMKNVFVLMKNGYPLISTTNVPFENEICSLNVNFILIN
jgi:hypothetical protein